MSNNSAISLSPSAVQKIFALMEQEGNLDLKLRIYIRGGGCSGFEYKFSFEQQPAEDDECIVQNLDNMKVALLVDPVSMQFLRGAVIDYKEDIQGPTFIVNNPNAKTTCGCGSSFSI